MAGITEYIESYFQQILSSEERSVFETRCETDAAFANEVAIYIASREALRETLLQQKMREWKTEKVVADDETPVIRMPKKPGVTKWIMYAAAACVLVFAAMFLFETNTSPKTLASNYIKQNYDNLSQQMSADTDDMAKGMSAYNNKNYTAALPYFEGVEKNDPTNSDAKKYVGLVYLQQKDYDKAIQQFDELSKMKLFSNSGDFLKALALLERDGNGDKEAAKTLFEKVVLDNEEGNEEAAELLKKF